jgi:teichuronic acid exporter
MAGRLALAALIVAAAPILPRLERQLSAPVKALLKFGVVLSGDRILWYFRTNFDIALVGARLGEQALGFYSMALTVARLPAEKLAAVMQPVAYPALSHAQGSQTELQRYFLALTVGAATLVVPVAVGLALTAHLAIPIMLGAHWAAAVVPTIVFSLAVPIIVLWNLSHPTLSAIGRVGLNLRFSLLLAIVAPPAIWVGSYWGVAHVAAASSLALVAVAIYGFAVTWSEIGLPAGTYIAALWPVVSSAAGMAVAVLLAGRYTPAAWPASARLALLVLVGGVVYPALLLTWHGRTIRAQMNALRVAWSASR